ncbi:L-histidine N(alpha)-methyltransferase [Herbaspirillum sp. LeCh32-8]|uniref:L-histidine N(alpha)-methyltransferase n=1 Tax=Herbaspirillum sp. LeCh32-8 TaxID=2821356 RepID=UPI001FD80574|nr:L-histidine N(alpha)-methyltransferase [Herbaspirillum sp. LeCh32-8]
MAQLARLIQRPWQQTPEEREIRAELEAGLTAPQAAISPKYLYDALGSKLFEAICELPEYYPTRTEAAIFSAHAEDIAAAVGTGVTLIDLGAGNCAKAAGLFPALRPRQYVPIDISAEFLHGAVNGLRQRFPDIPMHEVAMDFSASLELPATVNRDRRLFFYPGSSLGNFDPQQALAFLRRMRHALQIGEAGGVLLGLDLVKDSRVLDAAYDDELGVTAAFNLNMLNHVNRLMGADFNARDWRHVGFYNVELQRVEMHLEARRDLIVRWDGDRRTFRQGERIHTENSHKFTPEDILSMLEDAGFGDVRMWTDPQRWFAVCHARAR